MDNRQLEKTQNETGSELSELLDLTTKKPYHSPVLSCYGDVKQLTGGSAGTGLDGTPGMSKVPPCWIAEVLYGKDAPRVLLVRAWLMECYDRRDSWALVVVPLYCRFGERLAPAVRAHVFLQRLFRPLFDCAVRKSLNEYAARIVLRNKTA